MSDIVKLNLLESCVFPIVTYAIDSVDLSHIQIHELSVCYNMFRRTFGLHKWESVTLIQFFCGKMNLLKFI